MKQKNTVTIGIPAYNEEQNIGLLLPMLFRQKQKNISLKEILVYSDASSDNTNKITSILSKKYPLIKLIKGSSRKGKYFRVNQLFNKCKTDILVILDADIAMVGDDFLDKLVTKLISDKKSLMMSAHVIQVRPEGFIAKMLYTMFIMEDYMRISVPNYDIAPNFHGVATAYRNSFIETLSIPTSTTDPHLYIYLAAKKQNGFRYCLDAAILQNPPSTIQDVKQLMQRSLGKEDVTLNRIFGANVIHTAHIIPIKSKIVGIFKCLLKEPFYTPLALLLSFYLVKMVRIKKIDKSPIWEINQSTKKPIISTK